ncbi:MAG: NFACT RNA binding domain-containing protein [Nanoarchaeota archaeon]|nr:NFACT RNA binding domain-containing protein [Nanoarchaeota archaeon]
MSIKEIKAEVKKGTEKKENKSEQESSKENYTKFRVLVYNNKTILAGKNATNNEELVKQAGEDEEVFHTKASGSPFVNIKGKSGPREIKTASIFCASKSQDWRNHHSKVIVHQFKGKDIYKKRGMKIGTFNVRKFKVITVEKQDIKNFIEKQKLKN